MARQSRIKARKQAAWYHLYSRADEYIGQYPLDRWGARSELLRLFRRYCEAYFCQPASWIGLGNHYHAIVRFEEPREVGREELHRRALLLHPGEEKMLAAWQEPAWEHLRERLFNVSELMRNVQGGSASGSTSASSAGAASGASASAPPCWPTARRCWTACSTWS